MPFLANPKCITHEQPAYRGAAVLFRDSPYDENPSSAGGHKAAPGEWGSPDHRQTLEGVGGEHQREEEALRVAEVVEVAQDNQVKEAEEEERPCQVGDKEEEEAQTGALRKMMLVRHGRRTEPQLQLQTGTF
ncbi:hypothetical protein EYF80_029840 [Liparis tanakae]|uniref:Uncharacterized protein n=1 Tax=Liparis tanakae TaxID=230148 RepID=A0A4Z2H2C2_9TELE|nr:hypothetical protein EYF80_029840 [Liparis tanakae]